MKKRYVIPQIDIVRLQNESPLAPVASRQTMASAMAALTKKVNWNPV
ncbi:MAG: hypothetical protein IKO12_03970 [Bacteroidaceae bacterium]|nr:hypothetical protein [Bacteroidaceae bacterium]